jgi:histidinol-phosphate aminotransferase
MKLKRFHGITDIKRFDLGENIDGFSPNVKDFLENIYKNREIFHELSEYPDVTHAGLRGDISSLFNISKENIVLSTGLDSIIDLIARVFFEYQDNYLMPIPDFFLFENYSEKMGANPVFLPLEESNNFKWTIDTVADYQNSIIRFKPKVIWLSNPCNPTGQMLEESLLKELIDLANFNNAFIVVDEAFAEYTSGPKHSAVKYINKYKNLMVLRTFSKAYGLAGIRLGYLMTSSRDIVKALLLHRHHFPVSQLGINISRIALADQNFIESTRSKLVKRKEYLFKELAKLKTFHYIPSETNVYMLKNKYINDVDVDRKFKQKGIIASFLNNSGAKKRNYLRITVKGKKDNEYLIQACKNIDKELLSKT